MVVHGWGRVLGVGVTAPDRAVDVGSAGASAATNADTANDGSALGVLVVGGRVAQTETR